MTKEPKINTDEHGQVNPYDKRIVSAQTYGYVWGEVRERDMLLEPAERRSKVNGITENIIACVYRVSNSLGSGFLEKVYENALAIELRKCGLKAAQQHPIRVFYRGELVGDFVADLLVEDCVIVEVKSVRTLDDVHSAQCLNYLKATGLKVCLLVNFGRPRVELKRLILD